MSEMVCPGQENNLVCDMVPRIAFFFLLLASGVRSSALHHHSRGDKANIHHNAHEIWRQYAHILRNVTNSFLEDNLSKIMEIVYTAEISDDCLVTLTGILPAAKDGSSWFYRMLDASGRPFPAGTTDGSITDLGSYDQCLAIRNSDLQGQYCLLRWSPPLPPVRQRDLSRLLNLQTRVLNFTGTELEGTFIDDIAGYIHALYDRHGRFGICTPSNCSKEDLQQLVEAMAKDTHIHTEVAYCEVQSPITLTPTQTVLVVLILFFIAVIAMATLAHVVIERKRASDRKSDCQEDTEESFAVKLVMALSSLSNFRALVSMEEKKGSISAIHGIRVISMIWIILTHTYLVPIKESFSFARHFLYVVEGAPFQLIVNGWVLVDTFFFLGAMLATSSLLASLKKSTGKLDVGQVIANRISRLTPNMWFTIALITVLPSLGSGPMWQEYFAGQSRRCQNYWWATMFYFNNWMPESKLCLLHTWYLSADMQMFLISLLLVPLFYWRPRVGLVVTLSVLGASVLTNAILTYAYDLPPTVIYNTPSEADVMAQAESVYFPTYSHAGPYTVGVLFGFLLHWDLFERNKDGNNNQPLQKHKINPWVNIFLWFLSLVTGLSILLYTLSWNRGVHWHSLSAVLYGSLHRTLWAVFVGWVVYACATGNGGAANRILSCKLFVPLSRLSYMGYLMHFLVLWMRYAYLRTTLPFSHYTLFCEFLVNVTMSTFVAAVAYLVIEAPIANLYKLFLDKKMSLTITIPRKLSPIDTPDGLALEKQSTKL